MFRKAELSIVGAVLLFTASQAYAVLNKDFTASGHILPGEKWNSVRIYNDDTLVNMLGGLVDQMQTYDASMLNVAGGEIYNLYTRESSSANIFGGSVGGVFTWDHATTNLYDGGSVSSLGARGQSGVVNMTGGSVEYLGSIESGTLNLYGGCITDSLYCSDFAVVNIFGYDLVKTSSGGRYGYGQVHGIWFDDTSFMIDLNGSETHSHINLIPEPSSLVLFTLGVLLIKRKR